VPPPPPSGGDARTIMSRSASTSADKVYIGHTTTTAEKRLRGHEREFRDAKRTKRCASHEVLQHGDAFIEEIETYPCASRDEAKARERHWIERTPACVNKVVPGRADGEYRERLHWSLPPPPAAPAEQTHGELFVDEFLRLYDLAVANDSRSLPILATADKKCPIYPHKEGYDERCATIAAEMRTKRDVWVDRVERNKWNLNLLLDDIYVIDLDTPEAATYFEQHIRPAFADDFERCPMQKTRKGAHYFFLRPEGCTHFNRPRAYAGGDGNALEIDCCTVTSTGTRGNINVYPSTNKVWVRPIHTHPLQLMSPALYARLDEMYVGKRHKRAAPAAAAAAAPSPTPSPPSPPSAAPAAPAPPPAPPYPPPPPPPPHPLPYYPPFHSPQPPPPPPLHSSHLPHIIPLFHIPRPLPHLPPSAQK